MNYFEEIGGKLLKVISNKNQSVFIYRFPNGDVRSSDGNFVSNIHRENYEDALDTFEEGWKEIHNF